jgi:hypothetical protein
MSQEQETDQPSGKFGSWQDAEELRKWSFLQRTPQQRLDWLVGALALAYQCGALKPASGPASPAENAL